MAKGIMTNSELVESLIQDINNGIKQIVSGNFVAWNAINVQMVQKLSNLKTGIDSDIKNREETIEKLKQQLREHGVEVIDIPAKNLLKDGGENGSN